MTNPVNCRFSQARAMELLAELQSDSIGVYRMAKRERCSPDTLYRLLAGKRYAGKRPDPARPIVAPDVVAPPLPTFVAVYREAKRRQGDRLAPVMEEARRLLAIEMEPKTSPFRGSRRGP
jgi:hypothetical protein